MSKKALVVVFALIFVIGIPIGCLVIGYYPVVRVAIRDEFVGPEHPAIDIVFQGKPTEKLREYLAKSGESPDDIVWNGESLLYVAARRNRLQIAEWLLSQGANPNGVYDARPPLLPAISKNYIEMVELLIEHGANPDLQMDETGTSPRQVAEALGNPEVIKVINSAKKEDREQSQILGEVDDRRP